MLVSKQSKIIIALGLIFLIIAVSVAYKMSGEIKERQNESQRVAGVKFNESDVVVDCGCEKTFENPKKIKIKGEVMMTMVGGFDFGVRSNRKYEGYNQFYIVGDRSYEYLVGQTVKIEGLFTGITCAYANTVYKECVPEIELSSLRRVIW